MSHPSHPLFPWRAHSCPPGQVLRAPHDWIWAGSDAALDSAAALLLGEAVSPAEKALIRCSWRALRDPFYRHLSAHRQSWSYLEKAGLFDDTLSPLQWQQMKDNASSSLFTPLLHTPAPGSSTPIVLVLFGACAPLHDGHINMLVRAKGLALSAGWNVVGAIISPSHDVYVSKKSSNTGVWTAAKRVTAARALVRSRGHSAWIKVDAWESSGVSVALNYTDVLGHVEEALHHQWGVRPIAAAVFGGDNAGFAHSFTQHGRCVVINRPGHEEYYASVKSEITALTVVEPTPVGSKDMSGPNKLTVVDPTQVGSKDMSEPNTILWDDDNSVDLSSTNLRQHQPGWLLRDDGEWAVSLFQAANLVPAETLRAAWKTFVQHLKDALRSSAPDMGLHEVNLTEQRTVATAWAKGKHVLVLDPCLPDLSPTAVSWPTSRVFAVSDDQSRPLRHHLSPAPSALSDPRAVWWILDDDSVTGETIAQVRQRVPSSQLAGEETLAALLDIPSHWDPIDARDFLPGARSAGLMVEHQNSQARVPYLWPLVDLSARASIPPEMMPLFSKKVLVAAQSFFEQVPATLAHSDPDAQKFWLSRGYLASTPLSQVCTDQLHLLGTADCHLQLAPDQQKNK